MNHSPESAPQTESTKAQEPQRHAYDAPTLTATQFLSAVMHDPTVPIHQRVDAAGKLLRILYKDPDYVGREIAKSREPVLTYRIGGINLQ